MGSRSGAACDLTSRSLLTVEQKAKYQAPALVRRTLGSARSVAIVGLSTKRQKASYFVATFLKSRGIKIIPVHPKADRILGERVYPTLKDIPEPVDVVNVFRPSHECPIYAAQAVDIGAKVFWLQLGLFNEESATIASTGGLDVIMDLCVKMEYGRYDGTMRFLGMNTGVLTAKKAQIGRIGSHQDVHASECSIGA